MTHVHGPRIVGAVNVESYNTRGGSDHIEINFNGYFILYFI